MSKQKVLQIVVGLIAFAAFLASLGSIADVLPASWKNYAIAVGFFGLALEKFLVSINQILMGPAKIQSPAVQEKLAALPDKSGDPTQAPDETASSPTNLDTTKVAPRLDHP